MNTYLPTGIKANRVERTITIIWNDGVASTFTFDGPRIACPCVECKGGHANMGKATPRSVVANAPVTDLRCGEFADSRGLTRCSRHGATAIVRGFIRTLLREIDPGLAERRRVVWTTQKG